MAAFEERAGDRLAALGIRNPGTVHWNLPLAALFEEALRRGEGMTSEHGALVVQTGEHTGRAARDKYVVRDALTDGKVDWGEVNQPMSPDKFRGLWQRSLAFLEGKELFVSDLHVGADSAVRLPIRV